MQLGRSSAETWPELWLKGDRARGQARSQVAVSPQAKKRPGVAVARAVQSGDKPAAAQFACFVSLEVRTQIIDFTQ